MSALPLAGRRLWALLVLACLLATVSLGALSAPAGAAAAPGPLTGSLVRPFAEAAPTIESPGNQVAVAGKEISPLVPVKGSLMAEVKAKELPAGLKLEKVSEFEWKIVGTPTTAKAATTVTLEVENNEKAGATTTFEYTVNAPEAAPTIESPVNQVAVAGKAITPVIVKGSLMATVTAKELPAGLGLEKVSPSEWLIVGTPSTAKGATTVTLEAENAEHLTASTTFEYTVKEPEAAPTIESPGNQVAVAGKAITPVQVKGSLMANVTAKELPAGLGLEKVSDSEWLIVGTPTTAKGATTVTLEAENAEHATASTTLEYTVSEVEPAPTIEAPPDQTVVIGAAITPVAVKGAHLHTLIAEELPAGLALTRVDDQEWVIEGTPSSPGTYPVTLEAHNAEGAEATPVTFTWKVTAASGSKGPAATGMLAMSAKVVFSDARTTCAGVSWPSSATTAIQWLIDGTPISGATAASYVPPRADDGRVLSCRQTATGGGASTVLTSGGRVVHEQPPQPTWPIVSSANRCAAAVCMQDGAAPGAAGGSYAQGGSWWAGQQVRCVSAPWTSSIGDSPSPAVRAFAEAHVVGLELQRITSSGTVTVASASLAGLGSARDQLDKGASPFPGAIVSSFGSLAFGAGEVWSTRFPGAQGGADWFAPGGGLIAYELTGPGAARSFQLTYTLTQADLGARLRCVASAADGPAAAPTAASFASSEYATGPAALCAPRRVAGSATPQPVLVDAGDPRCVSAPSTLPAPGGFSALAARSGRVALELVCARSGGCRGHLQLLAGAHGSKLGSAKVHLGRGASGLVQISLGAHARSRVSRAGSGGLAATIRLATHGSKQSLAAVRLLAVS